MAYIGTKRALLAMRQAAAVQAAANNGWWTIADQTCVAAYQPIGAADIAASYINLANPGTYNCTAPVAAPAFNAATGWTFNGSTTYLATGIIPASDWSVFVQFTHTGGTDPYIFGNFRVSPQSLWCISHVTWYWGGSATNRRNTSEFRSGNIGMAAGACYKNGSSDGSFTPGALPNLEIYLGGNNKDGTPNSLLAGTIKSFAVYSTTLSSDNAATLAAAMAALT